MNRPLKGSSCAAAPAQLTGLLPTQKAAAQADGAGGGRAKRRALGAKALQLICGTHALAQIDQAVVSGTAFLTIVLVGHWTFPSELGIYSIGISLLASSLAIQDSLILLPYTIQRHRPLGTPAEHAGSSLIQNSILSAVAMVTLALTALALSAWEAEPNLVTTTWALAGVVPFALLREFGRGFAFAHLHMAKALMLDIVVAATQLAALGWLGWMGMMSATTACAALGAACALAGITWLFLARASFTIWTDQFAQAMKQSWSLGKWLCAGQVTVSVQGYAMYWLLPLLLGLTATGVYAACMSIASVANPFITAFRNTLTPRAVAAFREGGATTLRRQAGCDSLLLGAGMALFCIVSLFAGDCVMGLLYHGQGYEGQGQVITVLVAALLASAMGFPASNALASMERPRAIVWATSVGAILTLVLVWFAAIEWGLVGAAYGFLAGSAAGAVARWIVFLMAVSRCGSEAEFPLGGRPERPLVIEVLQQFIGSCKDCGWLVEPLAEGGQARVFAIRSQGQQPVWHTYHSLVVKLYKPTATLSLKLIHEQFESLSRLRALVHGRSINGWNVCVPKPLYVCESPPAMVTTMVPGKKLELYLGSGDQVTCEMMGALPRAIVAAMNEYWCMGGGSRRYGEFCGDNILCDVVGRNLSFIDLDSINNLLADDVGKCWYPASHDLAYLLYATAATVKRTIGNPRARLRKQIFTESVIQAFIETIGSFEEKQLLLDEIESCARAHVKRLDVSLSPRGLWHLVLKKIAGRRIDRMLAKLRTDAPVHLRARVEGLQLQDRQRLAVTEGLRTNPAAYITTSWDDGHPMDLRVAELLTKHGLHGTFYIPRDAENGTMSAVQIRELSLAFEIGAHTLHHADLPGMTEEQAWQEIAGSKSWLENNIGLPCLMFCPPRGRYLNRHLEAIRKAGYLGLRSVESLSVAHPRRKAGIAVLPTTIQAYPHGLSAFTRNAIKRAAFGNLWRLLVHGRSREWPELAQSLLRHAIECGGVFHLWGHSWELQEPGQWRCLDEVLRLMSEFASRAAPLTNGQICQRSLLQVASLDQTWTVGGGRCETASPEIFSSRPGFAVDRHAPHPEFLQ